MTLGTLTFDLHTDAGLTIPFTGTKSLSHQTDLSDGDQDFVFYLGSNTSNRKLNESTNPGVNNIILTPTIQRAEWQATTAYSVGDSIEPTTPNSFRYEATTAGTTDGSEPTFPTGAIGDTVADGTVVWTLVAAAHPVTEIKLALTNGGLAGASSGAALTVGVEVLSGVGNAFEFHMRVTNGVTTVGDTISFPGIGVNFNIRELTQ